MSNEEPKGARAFVDRCAPWFSRLAAVAYGVTGSKSDSEDIVQQAILIGIQKQQSFDSENEFYYWLSAIVKNCALNHYRKNKRRKTTATDPGVMAAVVVTEKTQHPVDPATGQLHSLQESFDDRVKQALSQLSSEARSCVLLRTVEKMSYKEIAKIVGVTETAASNLVHRSKSRLREILGEFERSRHE